MENKYRLFGMQEFTINLTAGDDSCVINPAGLRVYGEINKAKLEKAIQKLINECDALRFVFSRDEETGQLYQSIIDHYDYTLEDKDVPGATEEEKEAYVVKDIQAIMEEIGYLPDGKVKWKFVLYKLKEQEYMFWLIMSHVISDGLSVTNALTRVIMRYSNIPVPPTGKFLEYIKEQYKLETDPECVKGREAFMESMQGYKDPIATQGIGSKKGFYQEVVTVETQGLKRFARSNKMSLFHVALFLYHAALSATFRTGDTFIGVAAGMRKLKNMRSVGEYMTGFGHRFMFGEQESMQAMAAACKKQYLAVSKKDHAVYNSFKDGVLFSIAYQNFSGDDDEIPFGKAKAKAIDEYEKYMLPYHWKCLCLDAYEMDDSITYMSGFDSNIFTDQIMERLAVAFRVAAECLSEEDMTFQEYCRKVDQREALERSSHEEG